MLLTHRYGTLLATLVVSAPSRGGHGSLQNWATARLARGPAKGRTLWCTLQTYLDDTYVSELVVGQAIPWVAPFSSRISFGFLAPGAVRGLWRLF